MNIFGEESKLVIGKYDFVKYVTTANGGKSLEISISPLSKGSETVVKVDKGLFPNLRAEADISISNRIKNVVSSFEILGRENKNTNQEFSINSLQGNIDNILIMLNVPFTGTIGDTVDIYGCSDSAYNFGNLTVKQLQANNTEVYVSLTNGQVIPNTVGSATGGTLVLNNVNTDNLARYVFSGTNHSKAVLQSRSGGSNIKSSGILEGDHLVPVASTNHVLRDLTFGVIDRRASNRFIIDCNSNKLTFTDIPLDTIAMETGRQGYSSTVPEGTAYNVVYRTTTSKSRTVPRTSIVSISKSDSAIATVVCKDNHGLTTNKSLVMVTGVNDPLFPTTTGTVGTVINSKTFTIAMGDSGTGVVKGGLVAEVNGYAGLDGLLPEINIVYCNSNGRLTVNLTEPTTVQVGEYITLYGAADNNGEIPLNGTYRLHSTSGNDIELEPLVTDTKGASVIIPVLTEGYNVNIAGSLISHQTMRIHHMLFETNNHLTIDGQGQRLMSKALPVISLEPLDVTMVESRPSAAKIITTASNNATIIKTTETLLYSVNVSNITNQMFFLKLYDDNVLPVVETDIPYTIIPIPALSFQNIEFGRTGTIFTNGISIATTIGHGQNSGIIGEGCLININYK